MMRRLLDCFLLVVVVVGGYLAWHTGRERSRLSEHYQRLVRTAGDLVVSDPSKVYLQSLDTGEPLHFAWRVHVPANYNLVVHTLPNGHAAHLQSSQSDFVVRVRLRERERRIMEVYTHFGPSSGKSDLGDQALAELMRGRWGKVLIEQLGTPGIAVLEPDRPAVVLRLTLPENLHDEARKKLDARTAQTYVPILFELNIGQPTATPFQPGFTPPTN
jgi:hypothetical protein